VGNVSDNIGDLCLGVFRANSRAGGLQRRLVHIDQSDSRAFCAKQKGNCGTNARAAARNDC
jgi:hypothetical protein